MTDEANNGGAGSTGPRSEASKTISAMYGGDINIGSLRQRSSFDIITRSTPLMITVVGFGLMTVSFTSVKSVEGLNQFVLSAAALSVIIFGVTLEAYGYLQSIREKNRTFLLSRDRMAPNDRKEILKRIEEIKINASANISSADKEEVIKKAVESLTENAAAKIASEWENKYKAEAIDEQYIKRIRSIADLTQARLRDEIEALGRRANVNLALGMFISLAGTAVLGWFVYTTSNEFTTDANLSEIGAKFGIRFSLAVVIQIFAYFFLRLYRYSIFEIKYFQNEITSAEFRLIALEVALKTGDKKIIEQLCADMSKTERNFILKKGETTLALARDAIEREYDQAFSPSSRFASGKAEEGNR